MRAGRSSLALLRLQPQGHTRRGQRQSDEDTDLWVGGGWDNGSDRAVRVQRAAKSVAGHDGAPVAPQRPRPLSAPGNMEETPGNMEDSALRLV
jgi:hypothetical protein